MSGQAAEGRIAYTAVINEAGEIRLGVAKEGEAGYYATKDGSTAGGTFETLEAAREAADGFNERLGLSPKAAALIVLGTMRGKGVKR